MCSDSWWCGTRSSGCCPRTGTSWRTSAGISRRGTATTSPCTASRYSTGQYSTVQYYYTMYGKQIVAEYRDKADTNLTRVLEPTWREFVTYILNTPVTKFDEHWMPMWMLCSPCIIRSHTHTHKYINSKPQSSL